VLTKTVETQVTVGKCSGDVHSCIAGTPPTKQGEERVWRVGDIYRQHTKITQHVQQIKLSWIGKESGIGNKSCKIQEKLWSRRSFII
jgi:hypothetical protein